MTASARHNSLGFVVLVGAIYVVIGVATAELAKTAASPGMGQIWRLAAWLLSLIVFVSHIAYERSRRERAALEVARQVAAAVAVGGFLLAVVGPARTHWGTERFWRVTVLSLVLWPVLVGVPAFLVALLAGFALERRTRRAKAGIS